MTPTPPTRRQIDEMTRVQSEAKAANNNWRTCRHDYLTSHGRGWECADCGVGILSIVCPIPLPIIARALEIVAPSAGTCITPSQGAPE